MTRENKLALVVGFALILFVGILVSDHYSIAQTQESANLVPTGGPVSDPSLRDPDLLRFAEPASLPNAPTSSTPLVAPRNLPADPLRGGSNERRSEQPIRMGSPLDRDTTRAVPPASQKTDTFQFHDVRGGETLSGICETYYGDQSMAPALASYNDLADPNHLTSGRRLRIPTAERLGHPGSVSSATPTPPVARTDEKKPAERTYRVESGDVLSVIAQKEMGSARHWRALYEQNRDVIDDPDRLRVGVVLKIPANR